MTHTEIVRGLQKIIAVPNYGTNEYSNWIDQSNFIAFLHQCKDAEDIILYVSLPHCFMYSLLIPTKKIHTEDLIYWKECTPWSQWSYSTFYPPQKKSTIKITSPLETCSPSIIAKGEQLLFLRNFEGYEDGKTYVELSQRLTHISDIHYMPEKKAFCKLNEEGDVEEIVQITELNPDSQSNSGRIVTIKRNVLEQYLVLTNKNLAMLFDSTRRHSETNEIGWSNSQEEIIFDKKQQIFYRCKINPKQASYIHGFQIVKNNKSKKIIFNELSGINSPKKKYVSFSVYDLKNNTMKEVSCDPQQLSNGFEESNLPSELTPVCFKAEVLNRYKNDTHKYRLDDRFISCRKSWVLETYDINDKTGQVTTYLIYLSRLPYQEQRYWSGFNEPPKDKHSPISERAFKTDFLAQFDDSPNPLQKLKNEFEKLKEEKVLWWALYDFSIIKRVHVPNKDTPEEHAQEIHNLDKLIIDGLQHDYFKNKAKSLNLKINPRWNSNTLIKEILIKSNISEKLIKTIYDPLYNLHLARNKLAAHAEGEAAKKLRREIKRKHGSYKQHFIFLADACYQAIIELKEMISKKIL